MPDLKGLADAGRALGVPLIVDNTFATPYLTRPIEHGAADRHRVADEVDRRPRHLPRRSDRRRRQLRLGQAAASRSSRSPTPSYHGLKFWEIFGDFPGLGNVAFSIRARVNLLRDLGASLSPFNAQQILLGTETLSLRVQRHSDNALEVAEVPARASQGRLGHVPRTRRTTPRGRTPTRTSSHGYGGVVVFGVKGGLDAGRTLIEGVKLFSHLANVGDAKSLIIHPATTTHSQLNDEELVRAGIGSDFVRLSIGIEDIGDIIGDLAQALEKV